MREPGPEPAGAPAPRRRTALDFLRKLAAIVLVLSSVTVGIVGLMHVDRKSVV